MAEINPAKGVLFFYIGSIGSMVLGYAYWLIVAKITNPGLLGVASTALSITAIVLSILDLGIAPGIQRHLASSKSSNDYAAFQEYFRSGALILAISTFMGTAIFSIFILNSWISFGLSDTMFLFIIITILVANMDPLLQAILISTIRTDYLAFAQLVSGIVKIVIGTVFVLGGWGAEGIMLGVVGMYSASLIIDLILIQRILGSSNREQGKYEKISSETISEVIVAGLPTYIPGTIQTIGTQVGVLVIIGISGANITGFYYIALQIYAVIALIPNSINNLLYPYISGYPKNANETITLGMRLSLVIALPIVATILVYPTVLLQIIGSEYVLASDILRILVLSVPFIAFSGGVNSLEYSRGNYRHVFFIGLSTNLSRVILYILLIPILSGVGAALAFLIGAVLGLLAAIVISRRIHLSINIQITKMILILSIITGLVYIISLPWYIGSPIIFAVSIILYARTHVLEIEEISNIARMVLPAWFTSKYATKLKWILEILYGNPI